MSKVKISTSKGDMVAELYDETPIATNNFKSLIEKKFYDGLNFHRVIPNFVVQGGCPNGLGNGGPGYTIECEVTAPKQFHEKGVLSMAIKAKKMGLKGIIIPEMNLEEAQLVKGINIIGANNLKQLIHHFQDNRKIVNKKFINHSCVSFRIFTFLVT